MSKAYLTPPKSGQNLRNIGRPISVYQNLENKTVKILSTWAAPPENPQAFVETTDEATTGNRRIKYLCHCKACKTNQWVSKPYMKLPRACKTCKAVLDFTADTDTSGENLVTQFCLDNAVIFIEGSRKPATAKLQNTLPRFHALWLASPQVAFTFAESKTQKRGEIIRAESTTAANGLSEALKPQTLPTPSTDTENAANGLPGTLLSLACTSPQRGVTQNLITAAPENIFTLSQREIDLSDPDHQIHQEGWYDDLKELAETLEMLAPNPLYVQGWLVRNDTLALLQRDKLYDEKLEDVKYVSESPARYATDDSPGWTYLYREKVTGADAFF